MKHFFVVLIMCLFLTQTTNAQRFKGGILFGLSSSQIDGDQWAGYNKAGLVGGTFVNAVLNDSYDLRLGVNYMGKGSRAATKDNSINFKVHFDYIQIPVAICWKNSTRFSAEGGISIDYLANYKAEWLGSQTNVSNEFTKFDKSLLLAINYQLSPKLLLKFGFNYSVLSVKPNQGYFNNVLSTAIYYQFKE